MAYTPNPYDATQPVDSVFASTAAAEFRALKLIIAALGVADPFVGDWATLTGPLAAGKIVSHTGSLWMCLVALADVTLSEPTDVSSDWVDIRGVGLAEVLAVTVEKTATTGSAKLPIGTTAERDVTPAVGYMRYNSTLGCPEYWDGTNWVPHGIQNQATVATTSGTSIDITGIPAGIKRLTVRLVGVSTSGTSDKVIRLGTSGGVLATGYLTGLLWVTTTSPGASSPLTTGWQFSSALAADTISSDLVLDLHGTDTWVATGGGSVTNRSHAFVFTGSVDIGGVLDRVRITTLGGTDTFDAGEVSLSWEF